MNPLALLLFAPLFAGLWQRLGARGRDPSTALKMVLGLFLLGVGFLFMLAGGKRADAGGLVSPMWLTLAYLFHTLGELCLSPVGLSYVTRLAPARFASLLMGAWFLTLAAGNKIAGALAGLTPLPGEARAAGAGGLGGWIQDLSATNFGLLLDLRRLELRGRLADSFAIMDRALELGINFFDTANVYGWKLGQGVTEQIVGRWFAQG